MRIYQTVAVLGGGSFGTALAQLVANQGQDVRLWMRNAESVASINRDHHNPRYLSDFELSERITATSDLKEAVADVDWIILAAPSQGVRSLLESMKPFIPEVPMVLGAKGIENATLMTMDEVVCDVLGESWGERTLALSGPSFAKEIMENDPTAVVLACVNEDLAEEIAQLLFSETFRAYTTTDIVGVEMGGALKNVIALAAGGVVGLGWGYNTRATLITRGLAEITRFAVATGGNPLTLSGLSGMGDLVLTCTGGLSRNRAVGQALGEGRTLDEALAEVKQVAEGVQTARSAYELAQRLKVDAPITEAVYRVLYEDIPVMNAVRGLVRRHPGSELEYGD